MDYRHSPPRKRSKSFHAISRDTAEFAHPLYAETVPMDIDRPGYAARDSTTLVDSSGFTTVSTDAFHHEESQVSPEERRVEAYTRSIIPAPNTKDTATNDLFAYHMPKFALLPQQITDAPNMRESCYAPGRREILQSKCAQQLGNDGELVELADKMKLEIQMYLPWRDFITLAEVTAPLRDAGFELSATFNEEQWAEIPSLYRDLHKALTIKAITGAELDATNLRFQQDMPEFIADDLTAHGTRGFRPNKRRWHASLA
ncbi:hypothetical protein FGADI_3797 [Fusarium gaditjirri]|uniref:Uncharacterized protein n=1 Tax=Fusarium gaditjirri TaxID=282569 RepID=A0A8H4TEI9_9HYPO|nr:hypothetical protein FGADI_3797 [Fusarium gaditjirri]